MLIGSPLWIAGCNVILGYDEGNPAPTDGGAPGGTHAGTGVGGTGGTAGSGGTATASGGGTASGMGTPTASGAGSGTGSGTGTATSTGGAGGAGGSRPTCVEHYGAGLNAIICSETATRCDIEVDVNGIGCDGFCEDRGGECFHADCKGSSTTCDYCGIGIACGANNDVYICTCSRGCGSGPACQSPQVCSGGTCQ